MARGVSHPKVEPVVEGHKSLLSPSIPQKVIFVMALAAVTPLVGVGIYLKLVTVRRLDDESERAVQLAVRTDAARLQALVDAIEMPCRRCRSCLRLGRA